MAEMSTFGLTAGRFRKTATVDAWRWDPNNPRRVLDVLDAAGARYAVLDGSGLGIGTLESGEGLDRHAAKPGDWVLRGPAGEFYAHDTKLFEQNYVSAEDGEALTQAAAKLVAAVEGHFGPPWGAGPVRREAQRLKEILGGLASAPKASGEVCDA